MISDNLGLMADHGVDRIVMVDAMNELYHVFRKDHPPRDEVEQRGRAWAEGEFEIPVLGPQGHAVQAAALRIYTLWDTQPVLDSDSEDDEESVVETAQAGEGRGEVRRLDVLDSHLLSADYRYAFNAEFEHEHPG